MSGPNPSLSGDSIETKSTMLNFVDTNIFVYAASRNPGDEDRTMIAREILASQEIALSTQVLQEFYATAIKPHKLALSHVEAATYIDAWKLFPVQPITVGIVEDALHLCQRYQISYWDSAILAAARHLNCQVLLSEDLSHGQKYGSVTVVNPFLERRVEQLWVG